VIRLVSKLLSSMCLLAIIAATPALGVETVADTSDMDWSRVAEYRLVPGDRLYIDNGPKPDGNRDQRETLIRPDGRITIYPIGDVVAAGLTPMELQKSIITLLSVELRSPRVTVELVAAAGNVVHVLGRVEHPGPIPAGPFLTVMQAIAGAGGFKDDAARSSVIVMHRDGARTVRVARLHLDRYLKGEELLDIPLSRFDIVYVPRSSVGNVSIFTQQFFGPLSSTLTSALIGWELFNLDRVFVTRVTKE
jgi:protein involved in polysaccharide export with SLBB domain